MRTESAGHSDRTGESEHGSDLGYAPPKFINDAGQQIIFVDFVSARYDLVFDVGVQQASVSSTIIFFSDTDGHPVISLRQPVISAELDGLEIGIQDQDAPDNEASFKILTQSVSPGMHELKIVSSIVEPGPRMDAVQWLSNPDRLRCIFGMSDIRRDGGFLEAYIPSNYEYDHFLMMFFVKIVNSPVDHAVFTNGTATRIVAGEWKIEFPSFFATSCPWFHVGPADEYESLNGSFAASDGRVIPILVYTTSHLLQVGLELDQFRDLAVSVLGDLERDFGTFPHDTVTIFATGMGQGGMEYAGATATRLGSLRHELDHSYFARSITPANGDAGWMDEAIASWGDASYPRSAIPPSRTSNMGRRSPYIRTTSRDAYTVGRDFLAHLDHVLRDEGGLKRMLADFAVDKRHSTVSSKEFQSQVELFHGVSLESLFNTYINGQPPVPFLLQGEDEEENPHHISVEELLHDVFPTADN